MRRPVTHAGPSANLEAERAIVREDSGGPSTVVTRTRLAVPLEEAWNCLLYYEQIAERPPLHLRLLLPSPIRTEGRKVEVGDEARCIYDTGHLVKRVTRIERPWIYGFRVVEQELDVGRGMKLSGGRYTLREAPGGGTDVALETRYESPHRPRWLWEPIESAICHAFHRHILGAMRRRLESESGPVRCAEFERKSGFQRP